MVELSKTKTEAYACPQCASTHMSISNLENGICECYACGWDGVRSSLVAVPFAHEHGSDEAVAEAMVTDLRNMLAKEGATLFGRFLLKWGFVSQPVRADHLGRYVMAIARGVLSSIIEERAQIEKERVNG